MIGDESTTVVAVADEHRERARRSRTRRPRRAASSGGSSSETNAPSSIASSVCTATSEWRIDHVATRRRVETSRSSFSTVTATFSEHARAVGPVGATRTAASTGSRAPAIRPTTLARRRRELLDVLAAGERERHARCGAAASGNSAELGGRSISCSTASSHGTHVAPSTSSSSTGTKRGTGRSTALDVRRCTWRQRTRTVEPRSSAGIDDALGAARRALRRSSPRVAGRRRAHRTATASGSSAPTRGTGRARSPRRAPRRRRRARRRSDRRSTSPRRSPRPPRLPSAAARTPGPTSGSARARLEAGERVERVAARA